LRKCRWRRKDFVQYPFRKVSVLQSVHVRTNHHSNPLCLLVKLAARAQRFGISDNMLREEEDKRC
jgi:hypothetical protein